MPKTFWVFILIFWLNTAVATVVELNIPGNWSALAPILTARVTQKHPKMKLTLNEANQFSNFLQQSLSHNIPLLRGLQWQLPKTTVELLRAVSERGVAFSEAEKMAGYLLQLLQQQQFQNPKAFDENTSHIIGREWHEIDYSGEGMTWQKQRLKYLPYGVQDFKSLVCLENFFVVESKLPYFKKIYQPRVTKKRSI